MLANSLVTTVGRLDERTSDVLDRRQVVTERTAIDGIEMLTALCDLAELLRAGLPLPVLETEPEHAADEGVARVLETLFERGRASGATLDASVTRPALRRGRLRRTDEHFLVPLGDDPAVEHNWSLVCRSILEWLDDLDAEVVRVVSRLEESQRAPGVLVRTWQSALAMIRDTRDVLRAAVARHDRFSYHRHQPNERPEQFARWAAEHISNG